MPCSIVWNGVIARNANPQASRDKYWHCADWYNHITSVWPFQAVWHWCHYKVIKFEITRWIWDKSVDASLLWYLDKWTELKQSRVLWYCNDVMALTETMAFLECLSVLYHLVLENSFLWSNGSPISEVYVECSPFINVSHFIFVFQ